MTHTIKIDAGSYAEMLRDSLREVTDDLRTIDLLDLVSFIRFGSFTAIEDLIHSSVELFFVQGSLTSAWTADVNMSWDSLPAVTLGLEFRHPIVSVFFDLLLRDRDETVTVHGIQFEVPAGDDAERVGLLARALAETRLPRRVQGHAAPFLTSGPLPGDGRLLPR